MLRTLRQPRFRGWQKPRLTRVNRSHPWALGISRAYLVNEPITSSTGLIRDSIHGYQVTRATNNFGYVQSIGGYAGPFYGIAAASPAVSSSFTEPAAAFSMGTEHTIFGLLYPGGATALPWFEAEPVNARGSNAMCTTRGTGDGIMLGLAADGGYACIDGAAKYLGARWTGGSVSSNAWHSVACTWKTDTGIATYGGTIKLYVDGLMRATNNYVGAGTFGGTFGPCQMQVGRGSVALDSDKYLGVLYTFNRTFTDNEIWDYHVDPFAICYPHEEPARFFGGTSPPPPPSVAGIYYYTKFVGRMGGDGASV